MLAELTHRCPLQCPYCSNPIDLTRRAQELQTQEWESVFQQAAKLGVLQVHLSGGEPTLRDDLTQIISAASSVGLYTNLITAGVRLAATLSVPTDIGDRGQCKRLIDAAVAEFGRVDVLINSAYTPGHFTLFEDADLDDWRHTMEVNLFGSMNLTQEVVPHMKAAGGGSIVMVNSMIQKKPMEYQGGYATSKGALATATKMLAKELGAHKIRVNSVFMGWMWGPPVEGFINGSAKSRGISSEEVIAEITRDIPLGIIPDDADCANAVMFFASDLSSVITGAGLDCHGGEVMP